VNWVEQVAAMEARAQKIGAPDFVYMFPTNLGLASADAEKAMAAGLPLDRIFVDIHEGVAGAVKDATVLFENPPIPGFDVGAINCETNAGTHDVSGADRRR
jgi:hypothetical protein